MDPPRHRCDRGVRGSGVAVTHHEIETLREQIAALQNDIAVYRRGVQAESERLRLEAEVGRVLNRYSRRTWVVMAAGIVWFVLALNDAARAYATHEVWNLLFWSSDHGSNGFHWTQIVGFAWQAALLSWLWQRSQLPEWLVDRVRAPKTMQMTKEDADRLRELHLHRDST